MIVLLDILYHNILPVLLVAGVGFVFGRLTQPDMRVTSQLALYLLSPCLVFGLITQSEVGGKEFGQITAFTLANVIASGSLAWLVARALHLDSAPTRAVMLAAMFVNSGNLGLAVTQLAFGEEALACAAVYFVVNSLAVYTLGLYLAAGHAATPWMALRKTAVMPPFYAVALAGLLRVTHLTLPEPMMYSIKLIGQASIPIFLLILGVRLSQAQLGTRWRAVIAATAVRLAMGPLIGLGLSPLFGLTGPAYLGSVLEASMPPAIVNTIIAAEYDVEPGLVSSIVIFSTLLSPVTLSLVIAGLRI